MKIIAHENNTIVYGQDFNTFRGLPSNIEFDAEIFRWGNNEPEQIVLKAHGFGQLEPYDKESYGNGKIYISVNNLKEIDRQSIIKKAKEEKKNNYIEKC